ASGVPLRRPLQVSARSTMK
ncbi:hypothetical protein CFC21_101020, partial [Triticum aestivum]